MPSSRPKPSSDFPFHITARCTNKEWYSFPIPDVWDVYSDYLFLMHHPFKLQIHCFILMNNHFHLIASTPLANLSKIMEYFMRETSRELGRLSGRINQIYGRPYFASQLSTYHYFLNAYKCAYRNPVDAGICTLAETYLYSTLIPLVGLSHTKIPVSEDTLLFSDVENQLDWINRPYPNPQTREIIRSALKHREFKFPKNNRGNSHILESVLY